MNVPKGVKSIFVVGPAGLVIAKLFDDVVILLTVPASPAESMVTVGPAGFKIDKMGVVVVISVTVPPPPPPDVRNEIGMIYI